MGLIKGGYGGRSDSFQPGGASYECGFVPRKSRVGLQIDTLTHFFISDGVAYEVGLLKRLSVTMD